MKSNYRVAIGTIFTESNHLAGTLTDFSSFDRTELRRGRQVLAVEDGVVGGALSELRHKGAEIVPLLVAGAVPGGVLTRQCYIELRTELLRLLREALPVDAVLLPLHGAAAAEGTGDLEGDLLSEVRKLVGKEIPVVATLDLHAHVTAAMVQNADALLAWETYPHRDSYSTGVRGARMLFDILDGKIRPAMAMAKVPVIVGAANAGTEGQGPIAAVRSRFQMKGICTGRVNFGGCCNLKWGILQWSG